MVVHHVEGRQHTVPNLLHVGLRRLGHHLHLRREVLVQSHVPSKLRGPSHLQVRVEDPHERLEHQPIALLLGAVRGGPEHVVGHVDQPLAVLQEGLVVGGAGHELRPNASRPRGHGKSPGSDGGGGRGHHVALRQVLDLPPAKVDEGT